MSKPDEAGKVDVIEELREALPEAHELSLQQEKLRQDLQSAEARIALLAPELHQVARAIHNLRVALPAATVVAGILGAPAIPIAIIDALAKAAEDAAEALGI